MTLILKNSSSEIKFEGEWKKEAIEVLCKHGAHVEELTCQHICFTVEDPYVVKEELKKAGVI